MSKISFEGIGETAATFACEGAVKEGETVKLSGSGTVGPCAAGDRFCGVALCVKDGYASVQLDGLVQVDAGDGVTAGWVKLSGDGKGGVQKDETKGNPYLVVSAQDGRAVVKL